MDREQLVHDYEEAVAAERKAWELAKGKHASTDPNDKAVWDSWLKAANLVRDLAAQLADSKR